MRGERDHVIHSPVGRRDQRRRVITQRGKHWKGSPEAKKEDRGRRDSLTRGASGDGVKAWQQSWREMPRAVRGLGERHRGEKAVRDQRRVTCPKGWLKSPQNFPLLALQHKTGTNE